MATLFAGAITLEIIVGESFAKYSPHRINRIDHLAWFILPLVLYAVGSGFLVYENRSKKGRNDPSAPKRRGRE
jgi:hypothetical protein